jgi:peptidyl-prolyl cis-trans isomerase B (cyclophilin B)
MRRFLSVLLSVLMIFVMVSTVASCSKSSNQTHHVVISFEGYGDVTFELYEKEAPITVAHFLKLIKDGSYANSYVNRLQPGFVLQAGAGCTDNSTIKGEFKSNGVENNISHTKGVLSMARGTSKDSASNQFFVMLGDATHLDGNYAAFGKCTEGFEIIEKIAKDLKEKNSYADTYYYFLKQDAYIKMSFRIVD